jgi:hypothetical protein
LRHIKFYHEIKQTKYCCISWKIYHWENICTLNIVFVIYMVCGSCWNFIWVFGFWVRWKSLMGFSEFLYQSFFLELSKSSHNPIKQPDDQKKIRKNSLPFCCFISWIFEVQFFLLYVSKALAFHFYVPAQKIANWQKISIKFRNSDRINYKNVKNSSDKLFRTVFRLLHLLFKNITRKFSRQVLLFFCHIMKMTL